MLSHADSSLRATPAMRGAVERARIPIVRPILVAGLQRAAARACRAGGGFSSSTAPRRLAARPAAATAAAPAASSSNISQAAAVAGSTSCTSWPCKGGQLVRVLQEQQADGSYAVQVHLGAQALPAGATAQLHWGTYRSSPHLWQHPEAMVPPDSSLDQRSGAMRSPMQPSGGDGSHSITLTVPADLAPLSLAFVIHVSAPGTSGSKGKGTFVTPVQGRHFTALAGLLPGSPLPLGASLLQAAGSKKRNSSSSSKGSDAAAPAAAAAADAAVNFAVRCRGAERLSLVLLKPPASEQQQWVALEMSLDPVVNRTGDVWHVALPALPSLQGLCFGWRADGDVSWERGYRLQPDQVLLDPACPHLTYLAPAAAAAAPLPLPTVVLPGAAEGEPRTAVLSSLAGLALEQQQQGQQQQQGGREAGAEGEVLTLGPLRALEDMRVLEVDVRTFATGPKVQHPGTFLGVLERVDHIRAVGANTLVLTPCYATAQGVGIMGRAAVSYAAPDPLLSSAPQDPTAAAAELQAMVSGLHEAGIEVIVQFDFTFTAEGTDDHPTTLSLRGLDHASYYRHNGVLNCGHAAVRALVTDTLRHWAQSYGVDGFCFVNAENMVQDREGSVLDAPPLADSLCHDPVLSSLKLIALPSDNSLLPRGGVRGFPHWGLWQQRNTGFAADMLAFMGEATPGMAAAIAARLTGSPALFGAAWGSGVPGNLAAGRRPAFGVNCITVLGRQLLSDLALEVAQLAAAAQAHFDSGSAGGAVSTQTITKSLMAAVILSGGVPLVTQDATADLEVARFVGVAMRLRRRLAPLLLPPTFEGAVEGREVSWHTVEGSEPDWGQPSADAGLAAAEGGWDGRTPAPVGGGSSGYLAMCVRSSSSSSKPGSSSGVSGSRDAQALYLGLNPHPYDVLAALPAPPAGHAWHRVLDSARLPPEDATLEAGEELSSTQLPVPAKAVVLLVAAVSDKVRLPVTGTTAAGA